MKTRLFAPLSAIIVAASLAFSGHAVAVDSPTAIAGATIVTAEQAKQSIDKGTPVFDLRTPTEFAEGSIKGSVNVPYKEKSEKIEAFDAAVDSFDLAKLPANKTAPLVFFCAGVQCWKSFKGATLAVKAGYKKVLVMRGGWPEWKDKKHPTQ